MSYRERLERMAAGGLPGYRNEVWLYPDEAREILAALKAMEDKQPPCPVADATFAGEVINGMILRLDSLDKRIAAIESAAAPKVSDFICTRTDNVTRSRALEVAKETIERAEAERINLRDNPDTDGTDFAHPAWWRGNITGVEGAALYVENVLNGADVAGVCNSPRLQAVLERVAALRGDDVAGCTVDLGMVKGGSHQWARPEDVRAYCEGLRAEIVALRTVAEAARQYVKDDEDDRGPYADLNGVRRALYALDALPKEKP